MNKRNSWNIEQKAVVVVAGAEEDHQDRRVTVADGADGFDDSADVER